jgi:hypothetical protein
MDLGMSASGCDHRSGIALPLICTTILCCCGCTHGQLRYNTIQQANTLTEIYERQVLNNLAMFVENPYALPHFAVANLGTSNVTDTGQLSATSFEHLRQTLGFQAGRQMAESWQLDPYPRSTETDIDALCLSTCPWRRRRSVHTMLRT